MGVHQIKLAPWHVTNIFDKPAAEQQLYREFRDLAGADPA